MLRDTCAPTHTEHRILNTPRTARTNTHPHTRHSYDAYSAQLAREGALDFDDLLHAAVALLSLGGAALQRARRAWRHVLVDESQDTNLPQMRLLELLLGEEASLFAVGDPNQVCFLMLPATLLQWASLMRAPSARTKHHYHHNTTTTPRRHQPTEHLHL